MQTMQLYPMLLVSSINLQENGQFCHVLAQYYICSDKMSGQMQAIDPTSNGSPPGKIVMLQRGQLRNGL